MKRIKVTRAQLGAIFGAAAVVVQSPRSPDAWVTALGIVFAAFSTAPATSGKELAR